MIEMDKHKWEVSRAGINRHYYKCVKCGIEKHGSSVQYARVYGESPEPQLAGCEGPEKK